MYIILYIGPNLVFSTVKAPGGKRFDSVVKYSTIFINLPHNK